jgi:simple sugar transport system permease protein
MYKCKINLRDILAKNAVIILFLLISALAIPYSQYSGLYLVREVVTRIGRD